MGPFLKEVLQERSNDRFAHAFVLLTLLLSTCAAKYVLTRTSPKFSLLPTHRQRKLQTTIPIMFLHATVSLLMASAERESVLPKSREVIDYQFGIFYLLCVGYLFELLYLRATPLSPDFLHHSAVIGATIWFNSKLEPHGHEFSQGTLEIAQIPIIMGIYGVGLLNLGLNGLRLVYFGVFPFHAPTLHLITDFFSVIAWEGFITQWYLVLSHIASSQLVSCLGWKEQGVSALVLLFWAQDEVNAAIKLRGMAWNAGDSTAKAMGFNGWKRESGKAQ